MLTCLHVRNIGLIDEITLPLHPHLNIFTGETGAGKSMLIDSIQFAIGNKTSKQIIRKGQQCAYVKLIFKDKKGVGIRYIEENGFPYEATSIEIERTLYHSGRTVYKINGTTCSRQTIKELSARLIDVHGQHEPQSLLDVSKHLKMLDSFADETLNVLKEGYKETYKAWQVAMHELSTLNTDDRKKLQLQDMLEFQINEIASHHLKKEEEEQLKEQYELLAHAEKILMNCQRAYQNLDMGESREGGANELIGKAVKAMQDISTISPQLENLYTQLLSVEAELQDITYEIRSYTEEIEYSPENLQEIQNRLDIIYRLKQKYGSSIEEILAYKVQCEKELETLYATETNKEQLLERVKALEVTLKKQAHAISQLRSALAEKIGGAINTHIKDLQMPHALFKIQVTPTEKFNVEGMDTVEFLIRTNLGEDMHPLSKIASGGEISRVMLAIKTVLVLGDNIDTVIFDEIDTGISGLAAQKVGEKLAMISRNRQVMCITHLPQIAAMGDSHYLIEKKVEKEYTTTSLVPLKSKGVFHELCRLMGGFVTENTLQGAKEIKKIAENYKQSIV